MLVLTRRRGESIVIGDNIEIHVLEISSDAVRIGIKAPQEVSIYRREIYEEILEENIAAARAAAKMSRQLENISLLSLEQRPTQKKKVKKDGDGAK